MEFEDLQAIWDSQDDKSAFKPKDPRLLLALYQRREQSRRKLFREEFAPVYVFGLVMLVGVGGLFFAFLMKSIFQRGKDFPITAWDGVAFAVAAGAVLAMVVPRYVERKKHERTQNLFAPSLREELDRGIAQLDFELHLNSIPWMFWTLSLISITGSILVWEAGRLNGNAATWKLAIPSFWIALIGWWGVGVQKAAIERLRTRKRALEAMRAALDEETVFPPRK